MSSFLVNEQQGFLLQESGETLLLEGSLATMFSNYMFPSAGNSGGTGDPIPGI